jgi:hypothetical protein
MDNYTVINEKIPIIGKYEVVVVGGGTAGCVAAIASAREGAKTLLVEKYGFLGGTSTASQVMPMMHVGIEGNPSCSIDKNIRTLLLNLGYGAKDSNGNDGWFNPEMLKFVLEEMLLERKVDILYDTEFIRSLVSNNEIEGIVVYNRSGLSVVSGKIIVDCTGDAIVAYSSGVPCFIGDEVNGKNQKMSLRFMIGNINLEKFRNFLIDIGQKNGLNYPFIETATVWGRNFPLEKVFGKGVEDGILEYEDGEYFQAFSIPGMDGVMSFNCPEIPDVYYSTNSEQISYSYEEGRKMIKRLFNFMKKYFPGFENSFILSVAPMIGIRESRRIKGKYILSTVDYNNKAKFDDAIAKTAYPIDIHGESNEQRQEMIQLKNGEYFEIPFRTLVPLNIENLLVAGRCISSTFTIQSSVRIQPTCRSTGEAAGIAAAYCVKENLSIKEIDGLIIRKKMKEYGSDV